MIRVRFAPSPTGSLHVGGARTALFNWLFIQHARTHGPDRDATFVLRIEDTDRQRSTDEFTKVILDGMTWLGLTWDEGPLFQGAALARHQADARRLLDAGKAYLEDGAIRFRVSHEEVAWDDAVHGPITFHGKDLEDFVVLRADGTPVYNFAVVSDDIAMRITHVFRGDDHISNTPKQILLYRAFGVPVPVFGHVPMILGTDGKKLSKRHGATAVADYQHEGIVPQAMANFLALLGWSPGGDRELFFDLADLVEAFTLEGVQKNAAVFDPKKLEWMNAEHLRSLGAERVAGLIGDALAGLDPARAVELVAAVLPRARTTLDVRDRARLRAGLDPVVFDEKAAAFVAKDPAAYRAALEDAAASLAAVSDWTPAPLEAVLRRLAETKGLKLGAVMQPVRIALTGSTVSEPVNELLAVVGRDTALARIRAASAG
ncbi:MAG TPA: glutamate--tRNA ligase [Gemmatimonadales bacterium]|nr:glutamate--tRNA ligase [Gemmatimonadales bacterium]